MRNRLRSERSSHRKAADLSQTSSPRLSDVAKAADVSLATASRVLSGNERVGTGLRDRVLAAAQELNFVPNAHAQALARASTSTVGLVVHDVSDPYFSEIARGVMRAASEKDLMVLISNSHRDPHRELTYVQALRAQRVSSIVLAGSGFRDAEHNAAATAELEAFEAVGGRVALVGRHDLPVDAVLPDNRRGAYEMGKHLLDLGHRDIGLIAGPETLTTVEDRMAGLMEALTDEGVELPDANVVYADFTRDGGYEATNELLDERPGLTAMFALNDSMAIGALAALRDRNVDVPGEISLAGFDDIPTAVDVTPTLTTVRLPMAGMGATAMELALRDAAQRPRRRLTTFEVVVRASTARRER